MTIDAHADVHQELRKVVDNFMRVELEILRHALAKDKNILYEKPKAVKEKKKKKEKPVVDALEGKSLDEWFIELTDMKVSSKSSNFFKFILKGRATSAKNLKLKF